MAREPNNYWERRSTELMKRLEKGTENTINSLIQVYEQTTRNINKEISRTFKSYGKDGVLSDKVLRQLLTTKETNIHYKNLLQVINHNIKDEEIKKKMIAKYNAPAYSYRISRYQELQENIDLELKKLANVEQDITKIRYVNTIKEGYYHNIYDIQKGIGLGFSFSQIDNKTINVMLNENWIDNANFSKRIWSNSEKLGNYLKIQLTADTMSGKSISKISKELAEYMQVGMYNATRLVRTEVNHFANESEMLTYEELDIEKYRFIATLDQRTCERCAKLDNKTFLVKDRVSGKNYPPIHANDRCTTVAVFDDEITEGLQRRARDENGNSILVPQNMTYNQWTKEYKPKLILEQGSNNSKRLKMEWQEKNEKLESKIIKPLLHKDRDVSYRIDKYQNKIMELYHKNNNENMCLLDLTTGNLIGSITKGKYKTTVNPSVSTAAKMLMKKQNTIIAIHNHPSNHSFSLMDIKTFNKVKQIDTMILLTDDYKYYLRANNDKYTTEYLSKLYRDVEKETKKIYNYLNNVEKRDLTNQKFFKKVGWIYEKEKN